MPLPARVLIALLVLPAIGAGAGAAETPEDALNGQAILEENCGRCHAIDAAGASPLKEAPPLREVYLRYPVEQLESGLREGMGSRHQQMPQIQFSTEQAAAILNYLGSITGVPPSERTPAGPPANAEGSEPP